MVYRNLTLQDRKQNSPLFLIHISCHLLDSALVTRDAKGEWTSVDRMQLLKIRGWVTW